MEEYKHKHGGHRQRLKDKVRKTDLRTLAVHEALELLLTYTIPRKDTNPIAHDLLDMFSSIDRVVDANMKDLQKVKGVGEETALFFKVLSEFYSIYKESKAKTVDKLRNIQDCVSWFRKRYEISNHEIMVVVCLSKRGTVTNSFLVDGQDDTRVSMDVKSFTDNINFKNTSSVIVFHTHPYGNVEPSDDDIQTTIQLFNICNCMGIDLSDHVILNRTHHFSFKNEKILESIKRDYSVNTLNNIKNYKNLNRQLKENKERKELDIVIKEEE